MQEYLKSLIVHEMVADALGFYFNMVHAKISLPIIEARLRKGLTQEEVAERIGTKQSAIARLESGDANPSIEFLEKITRAVDSRLVVQVK